MLMYGVRGQWNMALSIGGKDFPADTSNVKELFWFETIHQNLPSLNLTIVDKTGAFTNIASAGDGVPIDITLGDGDTSGETTAQFNIQGSPQVTKGSGYNLVKINAVLNNVPYMRSIATGLMEGSSSKVLQQLAGVAGLQFDGDSTADDMVWLPNNKTIAGFVRHVANHGWVGEGSCMMAAVTDQAKLLYKNIMAPKFAGDVLGLGGNISIHDWSATSNGMLTNNNRGYGSTSFGFDIEGKLKELGKISFDMFSNFLPVSQGNIDALGKLGGRLDNLIRTAGNTHEKYQEAAHQNQRIRALFSTDLNALVSQHTSSELLQAVQAIPPDWSTDKPSAAFTGQYILTARTKTITRSRYEERCTLTTSGGS